MSERMKVIYITTTGDNTLELPTPLDVEGYLCGLVELAGKVVNLKGDLFLCLCYVVISVRNQLWAILNYQFYDVLKGSKQELCIMI